MSKKRMLFISHAEKDSKIVEAFVKLLYDIPIPGKNMFCSSISEIGVPIKEDIYDYLRNMLDSEQVIPIFMLSDNYYSSVACLNEMGAVWVKQKDYYLFLLPGFKYTQIRGAINPTKRGISLGYQSERELQNLKEDLNRFRESVAQLLHLDKEKNRLWERNRDEFIAEIQRIQVEMDQIKISLKESRGYCIGEFVHDECITNYDCARNTLCASVDFAKTNAKLCSIVIFTGNLNISKQYQTVKSLSFDLKAVGSIHQIQIECKLKNRDVYKVVTISPEWESYHIPLPEFGGQISEWESLLEIKFVLKRNDNVSKVDIEIRNLEIF